MAHKYYPLHHTSSDKRQALAPLLPPSPESAGTTVEVEGSQRSARRTLRMAEEKEGGSSPRPPSKLPRLSAADSNAGAVAMAASSPLGLGLGLGLGGAEAQAARPVLTFMQQQELEQQVLIYRYFAAGAPVPVHLVLPIWKSVAGSSFGPHRFPSLVGLGSLCFDYRSSMEPEPGRCRRTDGKKWRCSRDVVQGHKYCERHVHRGRSRSRKPVEGAAAAPAHDASLSLSATAAAARGGHGFSPATHGAAGALHAT